MTDTLFQTDSYLREFIATVVDVNVDDRSLALDQTAFYPGGGGQPSDLGVIVCDGVEIPVAKVKRAGEHIWHTLAGDAVLPAPGTSVTGRLDWERRYTLMRTHTALHILCGVVWRDDGAQVTGGNMEPLNGRMDFEFATMSGELVGAIEARCNVEVAAGRATCASRSCRAMRRSRSQT